jgi:hypothetical protein
MVILFLTIVLSLLFTPADKDECKTNNTCITKENCHNLEGGYQCNCPDGQPENATFAGGCKDHRQLDLVTKISIGKPLTIFQIYFLVKTLVYMILD